MKKISALFVGIIMLLALTVSSSGQNDSCLNMIYENAPILGIYNQDSIMLDNCITGSNIFAKRWYRVMFFYDPFHLPSYPPDTIIKVNWQDIDTNYHELRQMFENVEQLFGDFYFKKQFPHYSDSLHDATKCYLIEFASNCLVDSLTNYICSYNLIRSFSLISTCSQDITESVYSRIINEPGLQSGQILQFWPDQNNNRSIFQYLINSAPTFHTLSQQWNLYKMKCPMAWEITTGNKNTVVDIHDSWDLKEGFQSTGADNIINLQSIYFLDKDNGFTVGYGGISKTTNGGKEWIPIDLVFDDYHLYNLYSIKEYNNVLWIVGYLEKNNICHPIILKSTNNGSIWTKINIDIDNLKLFTITFKNENIGFAGGENLDADLKEYPLLKTTNGGDDWFLIHTSSFNKINDLCSYGNRFWAFGSKIENENISGKIGYSSNNGDTWILTPSNISSEVNSAQIKKINTVDIGFAVGNNAEIYKFNNDDKWDNVNIGGLTTSNLNSVWIVNEKIIFTAGKDILAYSTDGGVSWIKYVKSNYKIAGNLSDIYIVDINNMWIVGDDKVYYTSKDWAEPGFGIGKGIEQSDDIRDPLYTGDLFMIINNGGTGYSKTSGGNVRFNIDDAGAANLGKGTTKPVKIFPSHGLQVMSTSVGKLNTLGYSGVCPSCYAVGTCITESPLGLDLIYPNPGWNQPDIINISQNIENVTGYNQRHLCQLIMGGFIVITDYDDAFVADDTDLGKIFSKGGVGYNPSLTNYLHDIKPIGVGALSDGGERKAVRATGNNNQLIGCIPWDPRIDLNYTFTHKGCAPDICWWDEAQNPKDSPFDVNHTQTWVIRDNEFHRIFNKLDTYKDGGTIDIVAPSHNLVITGVGELSEMVGLSIAIANVSGVVGLMVSVDKDLGENIVRNDGIMYYPPDEVGTASSNRHMKAYNILTFTAKKMYQYSSSYERQCSTNICDPLDRYWSQHGGYGFVNAFRAVMHSIRNKADNSFSGSQDIVNLFLDGTGTPPNRNGYSVVSEEYPDGNNGYSKLLLMGGKNENGQLVLVNGGNKYTPPNNSGIEIPAYDNCYGTTILNNNLLNYLHVPDYSILAIDGILKQGGSPNSTKIITTNYGEKKGKILISGFLEDVTIDGTVRVDDLKVFSTGTSNGIGYGRLNFNNYQPGADPRGNSVIYGKVGIYNSSAITIGSGTTIIMPGGSVELNGTQDIEINSEATLEMAYASSIKASGVQKIIIKPGGRLVIKEGAMVHLDCEVEIQGTEQSRGEMIFEKNTLVYSDKITLTQYGTLTMNEGAIIMPETGKTGKVAIQPGANLTIDNHISKNTIALLGGIEVMGECSVLPPLLKIGTFTVANGSVVDLGNIFSTMNSLIKFEQGTKITLYSSNFDLGIEKPQGIGMAWNYILGELRIGEASGSSATVSGLKGNYKYACNDLGGNGFVFAKFVMQGGIGCNGLSIYGLLNIKNTLFENVSFSLLEAYKNTLESCTFTVNSEDLKKLDVGGSMQSYRQYFTNMLNALPQTIINAYNTLDIFPITLLYELKNNLNLSNCTFKDLSSIKAWDEGIPPAVPPNKYHFIAVNANNHWNVNIIGDSDPQTKEFQNFKTGVMTGLCSRVNVQGINFDNCFVGTADDGSSVSLCSNAFNWVKTGSEFGRSKLWKTYNNTYNVTNHAVAIDNDAAEIFRGNSFIEYFNGINNERGMAVLSGNFFPQFPNPPNHYIWGRNYFEVKNPELFVNRIENPPSEGTSPFYYKTSIPGENNDEYPEEHADIWLKNDDSKAYLYCGRNDLSDWSTNHLFSKSQQTNEIECDNNKFKNKEINFELRKNDYIIANPIYIADGGLSNLTCNEEQNEIYCWINYGSCDYFAHNDGNLPEISPDSVYLDNMFWRSYNDFCFGVLNCECMKIKLQDALQAATLGDSTQQKLQLLKDCLENFLNDPNSPNCPPHPLRMILGEINERLNLPNAALSNYNYILSHNPEPLDTMYAKWRIDYLNAIVSDTTHGFIFDSLMSVYFNRYITDITRSDSTGHYSPKRAMPDSLDIEIANMPPDTLGIKLDQNQPNPFVNLTEIQYFVSQQVPVKLVLYDYNGREIAVLIDKYIKPGWHSLIVNGSGLTQGAYILKLEAGGKIVSKTIHRRD